MTIKSVIDSVSNDNEMIPVDYAAGTFAEVNTFTVVLLGQILLNSTN